MMSESAKITMRPLTALQIKLLQECQSRELSGGPPIGTYYSQSARGLYQRGLFCTIDFTLNGKVNTGFCLTDEGKEMLKQLNKL